ncbi:uncharacterized protein A4U43_C03F27480 [Asparagus officinalis]|uniref:Uncharacterized protein n=1 Tax=Asparagus officinalis TaxID=4686 RepID=A0A5P1FIJ8_ASPOF|nr:uncharacterized protein A4U43_C03F27480 [Asparagus officinalis]
MQVDKFPNAAYKGYATYEEALVEWDKHSIACDSASSTGHVQISFYVPTPDSASSSRTTISPIYAFALGGGDRVGCRLGGERSSGGGRGGRQGGPEVIAAAGGTGGVEELRAVRSGRGKPQRMAGGARASERGTGEREEHLKSDLGLRYWEREPGERDLGKKNEIWRHENGIWSPRSS